MVYQPSLFDPPIPVYPNAPGFKENDTSRQAAESIEDAAGTLRAKCLDSLEVAPGTADEVAARIGESVLAIRPRFTELLRKGKIYDSGERRANASGRKAKVWSPVKKQK